MSLESLAYVSKQVVKVLDAMTNKFGKHMNNLVTVLDDLLMKRDEIYFKNLDNYEKDVKSFQTTNATSMMQLTDKVFDMNKSFIDFEEMFYQTNHCVDNVIAHVHDLRQDQDKKYEELKE